MLPASQGLQDHWHCCERHFICAQVPEPLHGWQTRSLTQSPSAAQAPHPGGGVVEPPHVREHCPLRHCPCAQEPFAHCWQSSVKMQSATVTHAAGGGGGFGAEHARTHSPCTHCVPAHEPSAQTWHDRSLTQSFAVWHCAGGGGEAGHVITHWLCAQSG